MTSISFQPWYARPIGRPKHLLKPGGAVPEASRLSLARPLHSVGFGQTGLKPDILPLGPQGPGVHRNPLRFGKVPVPEIWQDQAPYGVTVMPDGNVRFKVWAPRAKNSAGAVELLKIKPLSATEKANVTRLQDLEEEKKGLQYEIKRALFTDYQNVHHVLERTWDKLDEHSPKHVGVNGLLNYTVDHPPIPEDKKYEFSMGRYQQLPLVQRLKLAHKVLVKAVETARHDLAQTNSEQSHYQHQRYMVAMLTNLQRKVERMEQVQTELTYLQKEIPGMLDNRVMNYAKRIEKAIPMATDEHGRFAIETHEFKPDDLYMYRIESGDSERSKPLPDMRSQYQPEDVHGPSQVIKSTFPWDDHDWKTPTDTRKMRIYRFHVGTFTKEGTFEAAIKKLDHIKKSGFNTIEIMPFMEFPGQYSWGYDMAQMFAVENSYGRPDDLKRLVNEAHKRGIAVLFDLVYNHIGPEGSYYNAYDRNFAIHKMDSRGASQMGRLPWGHVFNSANPEAKRYIFDNARYWIENFKADGARFDMTKFINDNTMRDINHHITILKSDFIGIAEDGDSSSHVTDKFNPGFLGFKAQWNFDFHHVLKSVIEGIPHEDNMPTNAEGLTSVLGRGFWKPHNNHAHELSKLVNFIQSHDEMGNHDGTRLVPKVGIRKAKMASAIKYLIPGIPLNFMGEEYGETRQFNKFMDLSDPASLQGIEEEYYGVERHYRENLKRHYPQHLYTTKKNFDESKLSWDINSGYLQSTVALNHLRETIPALWQGSNSYYMDNGQWKPAQQTMSVWRDHADSNVIFIHRKGVENPESEILSVINLSGTDYRTGQNGYRLDLPKHGEWQEVFNSEAMQYGGNGLINGSQIIRRTGDAKPELNLPGHSVLIFNKIR